MEVDKLIKFQFHKGSIKTAFTYTSVPEVKEFQFHKGSIKTLIKEESCSL